MILFQAQIQEHQELASHYRALASQREALAAGLLAIQEQADSDLSSLKLLLSKCKEVAPNAIASLKSAVLTLFTDDDSGTGDDGGNQPNDPAPDTDPCSETKESTTNTLFTAGCTLVDEEGSFGVVIGTNNLGMCVDWLGIGSCPNPASGKGVWYGWAKDNQAIASLKPATHNRINLLTTEELLQFLKWDKEQLDDHWGGEWFEEGIGCSIRWGGATISRWLVVVTESCEWASPLASPLACQTWEDAPLTGQHCTITLSTTEDNKNNSTKQGEDMPKPPSTEMVHLSANCGYLKLKEDGRILAAYCWFSRKNIAESWMQQIEVIPAASVEMRESQRNSSWKWELKVTGLSMTQVERLAKESLHQKPTKSNESPAQAAGIEPPSGWGKPQQTDPMTCTLGEGDVVEVISHRHPAHHGLIGTVEAIARFSELSFQVKTPRGTKGYERGDLRFVSKGEKSFTKAPEAGRVMIGGRIQTSGNYIGLGRENAIHNARTGQADKLAALELIKAGLSHEEAFAAVKGEDYDF